MSANGCPGHPFFDTDKPIAFAHRGGALEGIENTMPTFAHAVELGYGYIETDVHSTADGRCVVVHDPDLNRVCGRPEIIGETTWLGLTRIDLGGGSTVPLLEDVLAAWPEVRFNIDAKSDDVVDTLVETLEHTKAFDRVCLGAFDSRRLARLRERTAGRTATVLSPGDTMRVLAGSKKLPARPKAGDAVQVPVRYKKVHFDTPRFLDHAHSLGLHVHYWTIDDADEMDRLLDLGADGIMTDRPAVLREVLEARGQW